MSTLARHRGSGRAPRSRRRGRLCLRRSCSSAVAGSSLIGATPRHGNSPAAGCRLFSEVTCHDVGNFTVSPSHAPGIPTAEPRPWPPGHKNERSSARRCATAVVGACIAPRPYCSTLLHSTTYIRCRRAVRIHRGTSSSHAAAAIVSRGTCCRRNFSRAIPGQDRTSSRMRARSIERSSGALGEQ